MRFRDAAAAAPFWQMVDWTPPTSLGNVARGVDNLVVGTLVDAALPAEPRADELVPYDGAPTLYHLEVVLTVLDEHGRNVSVAVPVLSGGREVVALAEPAAATIVELAPVGARVLLAERSGGVSLVALESKDGGVVAHHSSLDGAIATHDMESLQTAVRQLMV